MKKGCLYVSVIAGLLFFGSCQQAAKKPLPDESEEKTEVKKELKQLDIDALKSELGIAGKEEDGQYKITIPQNDLKVIVDGFRIIPPMGLGSWVAFSPTYGDPMIMGDVVVTEKDLKPVQQEIIKQGLTVTAIHNHFVRNEPDVMYMHIGGSGDVKKLAQSVKAVFNKVTEVRGADPAVSSAASVENTLDTKLIDSIVGFSGTMTNGVYKITIGRPDVNLTEHGAPVSTFLGFNTWASWQGTPEKAAVAGDFTMLAEEVAPVIKALVENNIEVVAVHNHMVHENPRVFFLHYWGIGPATKLANGLKSALNRTGIPKK